MSAARSPSTPPPSPGSSARRGVDLCYSRFARKAEGLCGFGYLTRTGKIARLAGMGVVAAGRRTGVARQLLLHLLEEARARGDSPMVLEVIEQNPAAHALYRSENFRDIDRLFSWRRAADASTMKSLPQSATNLAEISLLEASQLPCPFEFPGAALADLASCRRQTQPRSRLFFRPRAGRAR